MIEGTPLCEACREHPVANVITITDTNGEVIALRAYCKDCLQEARVTGHGPTLELA